MPLINITLAGIPPEPAMAAHLQAKTTALMRDLLHKQAALTVVVVNSLPGGALSADGLPASRGASLLAWVTAGSNTGEEKSAFIAAADAMLREALGRIDAPLYVMVQELPAVDWGYDGQTQAARRLAGAGVAP